MNIRIDKTKVKDYEIENYRNKCNEALDRIWTEEWLTRSVTKADKQIIEQIEAIAESIKKQKKNVIAVTSGNTGKVVRAIKTLFPEEENGIRITFMGDSLSPSDYVKVLNETEDEEFILLAITGRDDSLSARGAYATMKQLLVSKYGLEKTAEDIYVVASDKENYIAKDAQQNSCTTLYYSENIPELCTGAAEPALLILSLIGCDIEKYLDGFRDMLSSPSWDIDAADYSIAKAIAYKNGYEGRIIYQQRQLENFALWMEEADCCDSTRTLMLPDNKRKNQGKVFDTYLSIERDEDDIMMPFFEGCHGDGSLNLMMDEAGDKYFFDETEKIPGVKLSAEWIDPYNLGQFTAFMQLSNLITEFLYNN